LRILKIKKKIEFPFIWLNNIKFAKHKKILAAPPPRAATPTAPLLQTSLFSTTLKLPRLSSVFAVCDLLYLHRLPMPLPHNHREWVCGDKRKMFIQQNLLLGDVIALY
jgi:hypothetical protein